MKKRRSIDVSAILAGLTETPEYVEPEDWVLAAAKAMGGRIPSRLHLQKALYIASRWLDRLQDAVEFEAYKRGPWSEAVADAAVTLENEGLFEKKDSGLVLTPRGERKAQRIWDRLSDRERSVLSDVGEIVRKLSGDELLLYTYVLFGGHEKSEVLDRVMRNRVDLAVSIFEKGVVSVELAARLAGIDVSSFIEVLRARGIKPFVLDARDIDAAIELWERTRKRRSRS